MAHNMTRTTLALPDDLLAGIDRVVQEGKSRSRNAFVAEAVRQALAVIENAEIDAAFAAMASDDEYQREALRIAGEFEHAGWEALQRDGDRS
jgi:metal-responsive CopG/Arc/MetJ family transcriptional regulator